MCGTPVLIWSLSVTGMAGDVVVTDCNNMSFGCLVVSSVTVCDVGVTGSGRV